MATATATNTWIDGAEAARRLDLPSTRNVDRLVDEGLIERRSLPGVRARYRKTDVESLAKLSVRPAASAPPTHKTEDAP